MSERSAQPTAEMAQPVTAEALRESALRKAHEQRLAALGAIADGVAHDFTNVFAVILAYANFIKDASPFDDSRREDAHQILLAAGVGTALIRQLLAVAGYRTEPRPVDLNDSLAQIQGLLLRSFAERCELVIVPCPSPTVVRIDPVEFDRIVTSLVLTASQGMPQGGKVRISLERPPDALGAQGRIARMIVTDAGVGVSADGLERIFELFSSSNGEGRDVELGLAACVRSVEDAGGALGVCSRVGQGTSFTVDLPICTESSNQAEFELERAGHGEQVLIAESDPGLRHAAARAFERAGFQVRLAATDEQAHQIVAELGQGLDVLVADAGTSGAGGHELAVFARSVSAEAVVLLTRTFSEDDGTAKAPISGLIRMCKPALPNELVHAVSQALLKQTASSPALNENRQVVLIVEDDDAVRTALQRILDYAGYSTEVAATLAAARERLERGPEPSFLLCDLSLPDGSSVELLDSIRKTRPKLSQNVFILSGGAVEETDVAFARSGAFPVLSKPIDPGSLLRILGRSGRR